jgi:deoxyribodipyrimidine photo-lyase
VYSPYQKKWLSEVNSNTRTYLDPSSTPSPNHDSIKKSAEFQLLFNCLVPKHVPGFELEAVDRENMKRVWPAGEEAALEVIVFPLYAKVLTGFTGVEALPQNEVA